MKRAEVERFALGPKFNDCLVPIAQLLNAVAEGRHAGFLLTSSVVPASTAGFGLGDFIANSNKTELGTSPNKYVLQGWDLVDISGTLTWVQRRTFTGN